MSHPLPLGNRPPSDNRHAEKYPARSIGPVSALTAEDTNRILAEGDKISELPGWHWTHDQGAEGSCVGHAAAMERAICNTAQRRAAGLKPYTRRYDPIWLWDRAKEIDEWEDTNPGDDNGTSGRAAYDVLRTLGAWRTRSMRMDGNTPRPYQPAKAGPDPEEGVKTNVWCYSVDEIRAAFAADVPAVAIGIAWMSGFDPRGLETIKDRGRSRTTLPREQAKYGRIRGYHEVCLYGASDRLQAFLLKNSWGRDYPLVLLPYETMDWLYGQWADATFAVDR